MPGSFNPLLPPPVSVSNGGTGITAYGHHALVKTPGTSSNIAVTQNTWTKISNLTSEVQDANGLWDATNSQTTMLPAGGYMFRISVGADQASWQCRITDDGSQLSVYGGALSGAPQFSGFFIADGVSVYAVEYITTDTGKTIYDNTDFVGFSLLRVW